MQTQKATSHDATKADHYVTTYLLFVHPHQPVAHVEEVIHSLGRVLTEVRRVRKTFQ